MFVDFKPNYKVKRRNCSKLGCVHTVVKDGVKTEIVKIGKKYKPYGVNYCYYPTLRDAIFAIIQE